MRSGWTRQWRWRAFDGALALAPVDDWGARSLLIKFGDASNQAGRYDAAVAALEEAVELASTRDEVAVIAQAARVLVITYQHRNDPRSFALDQVMVDAIERLPPGGELSSSCSPHGA